MARKEKLQSLEELETVIHSLPKVIKKLNLKQETKKILQSDRERRK